jgi:hypothetical protein
LDDFDKKMFAVFGTNGDKIDANGRKNNDDG